MHNVNRMYKERLFIESSSNIVAATNFESAQSDFQSAIMGIKCDTSADTTSIGLVFFN